MTRLVPLVLVMGLLLIAGCGSDKTESNNKYVDRVNAAQQVFVDSVAKLNTAGTTPAEISAALTQLEAAVRRTAADMKAIDPPGEAKASHERLVASLEDYAAALESAGRALGSRDPRAQARAGQAVISATTKAQAGFDGAINEINSKLKQK